MEGIKWFFESNDDGARLLRTIVQGVLGVATSAISYYATSAPEWVAILIVPLVMAILSPIMAEIGKKVSQDNASDDSTPKLGGTD